MDIASNHQALIDNTFGTELNYTTFRVQGLRKTVTLAPTNRTMLEMNDKVLGYFLAGLRELLHTLTVLLEMQHTISTSKLMASTFYCVTLDKKHGICCSTSFSCTGLL